MPGTPTWDGILRTLAVAAPHAGDGTAVIYTMLSAESVIQRIPSEPTVSVRALAPRVTKHYPGRLVFLGVNLLIALILMEANMFDFLKTILGFYANCGMAWVVVVASDIVFNKYLLKLSPKEPEFRRGMLYAGTRSASARC